MKKVVCLLCVFLSVFILSSCGYNKLIYDYLSSTENYAWHDVRLVKICYYDESGKPDEDFKSDKILNAGTVYLDVILSSKEEIAVFYGVSEKSIVKSCEDYTVRLEVNSNNNVVLYNNGFYEVAEQGKNISVQTSDLIYMDANFFYVCGLKCDGTEYLDGATGLKNIIEYMDNKRSFF